MAYRTPYMVHSQFPYIGSVKTPWYTEHGTPTVLLGGRDMGIMSKLLTRDQPRPSAAPISPVLEEKLPENISPPQTSTPQENKNVISRSGRDPHDEKTLSEKIPCPKCSCGWFWESIYFDGVLRCGKCEPFPGWEFVGRKISRNGLTNTAGEQTFSFEQVITDGKSPGDPEFGRRRNASTLADGVRVGDDGEGSSEGQDGRQDSQHDSSQDAHSSDPGNDLTSDDPSDRFVEYTTADGRTAYALRGFNNPRAKNYDQRASMYLAIGVDEYDRRVRSIQGELREEILKG